MRGGEGGTGASPSRLTYREDDAHFKRRLDSAVQSYWVYNSAATILVCVGVFYVLKQPIYIGIITGLLILLVSNLYQTMNRISQTHRWEIYTDRVVIPASGMGKQLRVQFSDIESMVRVKGPLGGKLVIHRKDGRSIELHAEGQERTLAILEKTYAQYASARHEGPGRPPTAPQA